MRIAAGVLADDSGQDLIEYALLTAIIGIAGLLVLSALPTTMGTAYNSWGYGRAERLGAALSTVGALSLGVKVST